MSQQMIDVHTHIYSEAYLSLLSKRKTAPRLIECGNGEKRFVILPADDDPELPLHERGRPFQSATFSHAEKLQFMRKHSIGTSILSLANPWLDFLSPGDGREWARKINDEVEQVCKSNDAQDKLYAFGALPLSSSPAAVADEIRRLKSNCLHTKGVIIGTSGLCGQGLDDPNLELVYASLQETQFMVFLHPHYGLPESIYGPRAREYGHVLPLALGFPVETTIAFTRMYLSGVFDRYPRLRVLIAHAGATIPFLEGRISSCVDHEWQFHDSESGLRNGGPQRTLPEVLRTNVWLDAVIYSSTGVKAAVDLVGKDRVMFGTDHPFFPPVRTTKSKDDKWKSVETNVEAIKKAFGEGEASEAIKRDIEGVLWRNASSLFELPPVPPPAEAQQLYGGGSYSRA